MTTTWLAAGEALAAILTRENEALTALDLRGAAAMLEEKSAAVARFEALRLDGAPQQAALALLERLTGLAQANRGLLDRGIRTQKRVLGILAGVVRQSPRLSRYGAGGGLRAESQPLTITLRDRA